VSGRGAPWPRPELATTDRTATWRAGSGICSEAGGDDTIEVTGGHIVIVPTGTPHKFVNSGSGELRTVNIHAAGRMETEWLED
jgi:mannose-6-phosphate isomerase-like protein (cupin superfamily)